MEKQKKYPSAWWFGYNGTPLKRANVGKNELSELPEDDLDVVALSTQAIAERRITLIISLLCAMCFLAVLELICVALYIDTQVNPEYAWRWTAWDDYTAMIVIASVFGALLVIGACLMPWCHSVLKAFRTMNGAERLGMSERYGKMLKAFCRLSYGWGIIIIVFQSLAQKRKTKKFEYPLQIAVPENCGFGRFIKPKKGSAPEADLQHSNVDKWELIAICAEVRKGEWSDEYTAFRFADPYPDKKWFDKQGTPIKEINIHYEVLKDLYEDERALISVSTYALVKTRVKMITAHLCLLGISLGLVLLCIPFLLTDDFMTGITFVIFGVLMFFGNAVIGAFLMPIYNVMLNGFSYIDGAELLCLDAKYQLKLKIYQKISFGWGIIGIAILGYMGAFKNSGLEYLPHVGVPQNCGYDKMIKLYTTAEEASIADVLNALQQRSNDSEHDKFGKNLEKLLEEIKADKALAEKDKEELRLLAEEKRAEVDKAYSDAQASLADEYEQQIKPVYEEMQSEVKGGLAREESADITERVVEYLRSDETEREATSVAEKRAFALNVVMATFAGLGLIAGAVVFFLLYDWGAMWWDYLLGIIPFVVGGAFAIAGICVSGRSDRRKIFKALSVALSVILACCLVMVSAVAIAENSDGFGGGSDGSSGSGSSSTEYTRELTYGESDFGGIEITGCTDIYLSVIVIPSEIDGFPVTSILYYAFEGYYNLTSITVPDTVFHIGEYAFGGCRNLTDINYRGTKSQWESIDKDGWFFGLPDYFVVHCTDGDIEFSEVTAEPIFP